MKLNKFSNLMALGIAVAVLATGCRTKSKFVTPLGPGGGGTTGTSGEDGPRIGVGTGVGSGESVTGTGQGIPSNPAGSHSGWAEDASTLKPDIVYFDYDKSAVKPSEMTKVAAIASYLRSNPASAVRIEGNCDELGTAEYNRALGDRRAQAVREELVKLGIEPSRVDTISYGFDRPAVPGRDAASRSKNRRDEFIVLSPPK